MTSSPTTEKVIPYALLGMTAVTGLVDAVSFLSLGRVFTANMTGNIVLLAFATAHVSGLSIARSLTALLGFLVGALLGGPRKERPCRASIGVFSEEDTFRRLFTTAD